MEAFIIQTKNGDYLNGKEFVFMSSIAQVFFYPDVPELKEGEKLIPVTLEPAYNRAECPFCNNRVLAPKVKNQ